MRTAIVLMTHGSFGKELIASGELILGELKDVFSISLEAEKEPMELMSELETLLQSDFDQYILLADLFGGTPCNVAARFSLEDNVIVLSGVNLPMLIEAEMARMQGSYDGLEENLMKSAREGIKEGREMMEGIRLVRIDFRLIHGQVITKWSKLTDVKSIVVVNDELAADEFMADIYVIAAPPGMQVDVISKDQFVQGVKDGKFDSGKILVLFKNIEDVREVVEKGVAFKQVQVGGLGSGNGRTSVVKGISVDKTDIANLTFVQEQGAEVTFQVTPEEPKLSLEKASKKVG